MTINQANKDSSIGFQGDDLAVSDESMLPTYPPTEEDIEMSFEGDDETDSEHAQEEEVRSGLQSDDEEWEQELTGERPDNGYLPGQRIAEHGIERENFPRTP